MSDAVLQDLIVRMASDASFADSVRSNPAQALHGLDLTDAETQHLLTLTADPPGGATGLDPRQSKSSLFFGGAIGDIGHHAVPPDVHHVDTGGTAMPPPAPSPIPIPYPNVSPDDA